jgi:hypothetical protein
MRLYSLTLEKCKALVFSDARLTVCGWLSTFRKDILLPASSEAE